MALEHFAPRHLEKLRSRQSVLKAVQKAFGHQQRGRPEAWRSASRSARDRACGVEETVGDASRFESQSAVDSS